MYIYALMHVSIHMHVYIHQCKAIGTYRHFRMHEYVLIHVLSLPYMHAYTSTHSVLRHGYVCVDAVHGYLWYGQVDMRPRQGCRVIGLVATSDPNLKNWFCPKSAASWRFFS